MLLPTRERMFFKEHTPVPVWVASPILLLLRLVDVLSTLLASCPTFHHSETAYSR